jgi:hypothetical protein
MQVVPAQHSVVVNEKESGAPLQFHVIENTNKTGYLFWRETSKIAAEIAIIDWRNASMGQRWVQPMRSV